MIEPLRRQALVGVQGAASHVVHVDDAAIDTLLQRAVDGATPAQALLRQAALLTAAARAQLRPQQPRIVPSPPLPGDARPPLPPAASDLLAQVLRGDDEGLLDALLEQVTRDGWRLPETVLVSLLLQARTSEQRQRLRDLGSPRLCWLAAHNPDWAWARADVSVPPEQAFELETGRARADALQRWRARDANAARERLQAGWGECDLHERARLLPVLETGLGLDDEPFLESCLDDRRKEVRRAAQDLLSRLPESQLIQRCCARLLPLVAIDGPRRQLVIELPAAHDKAMLRDGIESKPLDGRGERQHWLLQLLERVPPARLARHLNVDSDELLRLLAAHEDRRDLLIAVARAARQQGNCKFIDGWLDRVGEQKVLADVFLEYLAEDALRRNGETRLQALLEDSALAASMLQLLPSLLATLPGPWSREFARVLLQVIEAGAKLKDWGARVSAAQCVALASLKIDPLSPELDAWRTSPATVAFNPQHHARLNLRLDIRSQFANLTRS